MTQPAGLVQRPELRPLEKPDKPIGNTHKEIRMSEESETRDILDEHEYNCLSCTLAGNYGRPATRHIYTDNWTGEIHLCEAHYQKRMMNMARAAEELQVKLLKTASKCTFGSVDPG
jgi:hypothetical protein